MPGYYIHLAACHPQALKERGFILGVEAPDLLKKHLQLYGAEGAYQKYEQYKTEDMPAYETLKTRIGQKESRERTDGLHYGVSSHPNLNAYWDSLSKEQKSKPFYIGYLWHLITDKLMYEALNLEEQFRLEAENGSEEDPEKMETSRKEALHADWDQTNAWIQFQYQVQLTDEIKELQVVKFQQGNSLTYVDEKVIGQILDQLRKMQPLQYDMDRFLDYIQSK